MDRRVRHAARSAAATAARQGSTDQSEHSSGKGIFSDDDDDDDDDADADDDAVNDGSFIESNQEVFGRFFATGKLGESIVKQKGEYYEQLLQITALFLTIDAVWPSESHPAGNAPCIGNGTLWSGTGQRKLADVVDNMPVVGWVSYYLEMFGCAGDFAAGIEPVLLVCVALFICDRAHRTIGNDNMINAFMGCSFCFVFGLYLKREQPLALAVKLSLRGVGVVAGVCSLIFSSTIAFGIRKAYTRSMYMYGVDLTWPEFLPSSVIKKPSLAILRRECDGGGGAGPLGVVRHINKFEKDVASKIPYVQQRACWFAREWYDVGPLDSNRWTRKWSQDQLARFHVTPKIMAKWSIGLFQFMVLAVCWGPVVHCSSQDGGGEGSGAGEKGSECTGRCEFDWDYAYVASIITIALQLFALSPPNGGKK